MKIIRFKLGQQARWLACLAMVPGVHAFADESTSKSESKTQSTSSQIEVQIQSNEQKPEGSSHQDQQNIAVAIGVAGDTAGTIEAAINKLEKQLKASGLTQEIQKQALGALRAQLKKQAVSGYQMQFQMSKSGLPNVTVQKVPDVVGTPSHGLAFKGELNLSHPLATDQKKKLRNAISEALEQSGVSSESLDKSLDNVDKALDEFMFDSKWGWGEQKPPYRIGIGCKMNDEGDKTPGLEIESVFDDSPASTAGLKVGDRLVSVDDKVIDSIDDIVSAVQSAGEKKRSIELKATREGVESDYEIKPSQAAIAEMNPGMNIPGMMFPGQTSAWVTPQFPPNFDPQIQEQIHDAMNAARNSLPRGLRGKEALPESQSEKNIDQLRDEFSALRKDLDEIKTMLKKLSDMPKGERTK